jgi:hypothetical protein
MLCTTVIYSKRLTKYYPDYLVHNVLNAVNLLLSLFVTLTKT